MMQRNVYTGTHALLGAKARVSARSTRVEAMDIEGSRIQETMMAAARPKERQRPLQGGSALHAANIAYEAGHQFRPERVSSIPPEWRRQETGHQPRETSASNALAAEHVGR